MLGVDECAGSVQTKRVEIVAPQNRSLNNERTTGKMGTSMKQSVLVARYDLVSGVVVVGVPDLEAIRQAVVTYLQNPGETFEKIYNQFKTQFVHELEEADAVVGIDRVARLDSWILEPNEDATALFLVRHPARTAVMYQYYADLMRDRQKNWMITNFGHRRVTE